MSERLRTSSPASSNFSTAFTGAVQRRRVRLPVGSVDAAEASPIPASSACGLIWRSGSGASLPSPTSGADLPERAPALGARRPQPPPRRSRRRRPSLPSVIRLVSWPPRARARGVVAARSAKSAPRLATNRRSVPPLLAPLGASVASDPRIRARPHESARRVTAAGVRVADPGDLDAAHSPDRAAHEAQPRVSREAVLAQDARPSAPAPAEARCGRTRWPRTGPVRRRCATAAGVTRAEARAAATYSPRPRDDTGEPRSGWCGAGVNCPVSAAPARGDRAAPRDVGPTATRCRRRCRRRFVGRARRLARARPAPSVPARIADAPRGPAAAEHPAAPAGSR